MNRFLLGAVISLVVGITIAMGLFEPLKAVLIPTFMVSEVAPVETERIFSVASPEAVVFVTLAIFAMLTVFILTTTVVRRKKSPVWAIAVNSRVLLVKRWLARKVEVGWSAIIRPQIMGV